MKQLLFCIFLLLLGGCSSNRAAINRTFEFCRADGWKCMCGIYKRRIYICRLCLRRSLFHSRHRLEKVIGYGKR